MHISTDISAVNRTDSAGSSACAPEYNIFKKTKQMEVEGYR